MNLKSQGGEENRDENGENVASSRNGSSAGLIWFKFIFPSFDGVADLFVVVVAIVAINLDHFNFYLI
jgi:hypothetical protein